MHKLSDKIWVTRKCHINAETRLKRWALVSNMLITAYSFYLIVASAIAIKSTLPHFEIISLVGSILLLTASVFTWGLRFSERAEKFKTSYIRLNALMEEAKSAESNNLTDNLSRTYKAYEDVLYNCENHAERDHLKLRYRLRDTKDKTVPDVTKADITAHLSIMVLETVLYVFLFTAPLVALYCYAV